MTEPIRVSYSQLSVLRQCPLKFFLHYKQGWRQVEDRSVNLLVGSVWHRMLEAHYGVIKDYQEHMPTGYSPMPGTPAETKLLVRCKDAAMQVFADAEEAGEVPEKEWEALPWMLGGYQERYGCDRQWKILDVEYMGLVPLGDIMIADAKGWTKRQVVLDFRIDMVVKDTELGGVFAIEQKSARTLSSRFAMELDDQTALYEWGFRNSDHPLALKINGCTRSESKKAMNAGDRPGASRGKAQALSDRFQRQHIPRTPGELDAVAKDALAATQAAYGGNLPLYSAPNPAECGWRCQFKEVHVLARKGKHLPTLMKDFGFRQVPTDYNGLSRD